MTNVDQIHNDKSWAFAWSDKVREPSPPAPLTRWTNALLITVTALNSHSQCSDHWTIFLLAIRGVVTLQSNCWCPTGIRSFTHPSRWVSVLCGSFSGGSTLWICWHTPPWPPPTSTEKWLERWSEGQRPTLSMQHRSSPRAERTGTRPGTE